VVGGHEKCRRNGIAKPLVFIMVCDCTTVLDATVAERDVRELMGKCESLTRVCHVVSNADGRLPALPIHLTIHSKRRDSNTADVEKTGDGVQMDTTRRLRVDRCAKFRGEFLRLLAPTQRGG
jgi:hypothetical protein